MTEGVEMRRVWLFSMDSEGFHAPPLTTGGLQAYHQACGRSGPRTRIELVHLREGAEIRRWWASEWPRIASLLGAANRSGPPPVFGFSMYTWNAAEFLDLARQIRAAAQGAWLVAGGPHVQRAEDYLGDEPFDVIVLGEGEITFSELLDAERRADWAGIAGLAFCEDGRVRRTQPRPRVTDLDALPSALDVVQLRDARGRPLYRQATYETARGCPFRCAFCEWGTGAIGTKMIQHSLERIRRDFERLVEGGVEDLWLADSNFGALREDLAKAELVVDLKRRTGRPRSFATSWSKNHNRRVQEIVRLLHRNGLLSHYNLALQTLTPLALELSHRRNMRANDYEPVVRQLAAEGIPVAAELIWGLPGDTLAEFEANLDHLLRVFPNINIFGYTLLPGTEFFDRREEYRLQTVPVAGYGKAKGEYVVGCHTFSRDEGEMGYFSITAYIVLIRGQIMPLTVRHLALSGMTGTARLLRRILERLVCDRDPQLARDRIAVYEGRREIYLTLLGDRRRTYRLIAEELHRWLARHRPDLCDDATVILSLEEALAPRPGASHVSTHAFPFAAHEVERRLSAMCAADKRSLRKGNGVVLSVHHPANLGTSVRDPDAGLWARGRILSAASEDSPAAVIVSE